MTLLVNKICRLISNKKYIVRLTDDERQVCRDVVQKLKGSSQKVRRAQMLLKADADGPAWTDQQIAEAFSCRVQTVENLRRLTRALRPIYLEDLGLVTALEMLAREMSQGEQLIVALQREGDERRLPHEVELSLYRIVQESVSNIERHSRATEASIEVKADQREIRISIQDNGRGFAQESNGRHGLLV